ncbi:transglutaminase [Fibrobacterales bacterium]|nr:transglutaminase [Fibrobacterales bacterium]
MQSVSYIYRTKVHFSAPVRSHYFLLRCLPAPTPFQETVLEKCHIFPQIELCRSVDSFGNIVQSGSILESHDYFEIESYGEIRTIADYYILQAYCNPIYKYPSKYTAPSDEIRTLHKSVNLHKGVSITEQVHIFSRLVHDSLIYEKLATTTTTTAADALLMGKGVCQDFAHLLISLCRLSNIPARYVTGFIEGEGFTHAWIEFYDNGFWMAIDPTHNRFVKQGYIKLSHGRDYEDCSVERGVFSGIAEQKLEVFLNVWIKEM